MAPNGFQNGDREQKSGTDRMQIVVPGPKENDQSGNSGYPLEEMPWLQFHSTSLTA